jgi:hypothetical protein
VVTPVVVPFIAIIDDVGCSCAVTSLIEPVRCTSSYSRRLRLGTCALFALIDESYVVCYVVYNLHTFCLQPPAVQPSTSIHSFIHSFICIPLSLCHTHIHTHTKQSLTHSQQNNSLSQTHTRVKTHTHINTSKNNHSLPQQNSSISLHTHKHTQITHAHT